MLWPVAFALFLVSAAYLFFYRSALAGLLAGPSVQAGNLAEGWKTGKSRIVAVLFAAVCTAAASRVIFSDAYFSGLFAAGELWEILLLVIAEELFFRAITQRFLGMVGQAIAFALIMAVPFSPQFQSYAYNVAFLIVVGLSSGLIFRKFGLNYSIGYRIATVFAFVLAAYSGTLLLSSLILLLPFALLSLEGREFDDASGWLGLKKIDLRFFFLHVMALFLATVLAINIVAAGLAAIGISDEGSVAKIVTTQSAFVLLFSVTIGPIGEELLFRGYLVKKTGILASSALFGLAHYSYGSVVEMVAAVAIGLILAAYVKYEGNVYPAIAVHAVYNAATLALLL